MTEGSFHLETSICVPRRKAPTRERLHKHSPSDDLLGSSFTRQLPSGRLISNQATATLTAHSWGATIVWKVRPHQATAMAHPQSGNYHPICSSPIAVLPICLYSEEGSPHLRITIQTPIFGFQMLILNWQRSKNQINRLINRIRWQSA